MSSTADLKTPGASEDSKCLARSVVEALNTEPTLEAVTINRAQQKISLATLGKADVPRLTENITERIQKTYAESSEDHCMLLKGLGDCRTCAAPLSPNERQKITIQHQGDSTTIARVTCPTAPKFWRWRDIPWPKVVQRDVEFLEHADEVDEWKAQLAAAALCGVCALAGYFSPAPFRIFGNCK